MALSDHVRWISTRRRAGFGDLDLDLPFTHEVRDDVYRLEGAAQY